MAWRPVFLHRSIPHPSVEEVPVEFVWHAGMALAQAQKSVSSLHAAAALKGIGPLLEVSTRSQAAEGIALSAFNLQVHRDLQHSMTVECAFQGSKVFEHGGPYTDLYGCTSREAQRDPRLRDSGALVGFSLCGTTYPIEPRTLFYDLLYARAVCDAPKLLDFASNFEGFTDIAFNPKRSLNCQARALSFAVALKKANALESSVATLRSWQQAHLGGAKPGHRAQGHLF